MSVNLRTQWVKVMKAGGRINGWNKKVAIVFRYSLDYAV